MAVSEDEKARRSAEVSDLLDTVKAYATQETIGPLKVGAKAAGLGLAGVFLLGFGIIILEVALLRVLQTETTAFEGDLMSAVPYVIVLVVTLVCIAIAVWLIKTGATKPVQPTPTALPATAAGRVAARNGTRPSG
jgi:hypothetical protein